MPGPAERLLLLCGALASTACSQAPALLVEVSAGPGVRSDPKTLELIIRRGTEEVATRTLTLAQGDHLPQSVALSSAGKSTGLLHVTVISKADQLVLGVGQADGELSAARPLGTLAVVLGCPAAAGTACECSPIACVRAGATCGSVGDRCGGLIKCGTCPAGQTCGAAGPNACGQGSCSAKSCGTPNRECGLVDDGCGMPIECGSCPAGGGRSCVAGRCVCPSTERDCGSLCAPSSGCCGADDCKGGMACERGLCSCPSGQEDCAGSCIPGSACCSATDCSGGKLCQPNGGCACPAGQRDCTGTCIPSASCCASSECSGGKTCQAGTCACPLGSRACGGTCIPSSNCCVNAECSGGKTCQLGACACASGMRDCAGTCIPTSGCCGDGDCASPKTCVGGACTCPNGYTDCGGACVTLAFDKLNCGSCGHACPNARECMAGLCLCVDPTDDSDKHCCPANMSFLRSQSPGSLSFCFDGPYPAASIAAAEADCKTRIGVSGAGMGKWGTSTLYAAVPQGVCGYWWDGRSQGNGWVGVYGGMTSSGGGSCSASCSGTCQTGSCTPAVVSLGCTQPYYCVRDPNGPRTQYCNSDDECPPATVCTGFVAKFCSTPASPPSLCASDADCPALKTCTSRGPNSVTGVCK